MFYRAVWFGLVWFEGSQTGFKPNQTVPSADGVQSYFQYIGNIDKAENDGQKVFTNQQKLRSRGHRRPAYRDDIDGSLRQSPCSARTIFFPWSPSARDRSGRLGSSTFERLVRGLYELLLPLMYLPTVTFLNRLLPLSGNKCPIPWLFTVRK